MPTDTVDLVVDLNTTDDSGLPGTFLDPAADPSKVQPGHYCSLDPARPAPWRS